ncbi:GtrA family protein [Luteimonas aestuarii]|uniref:GtrA family protein n=1 Tax=Luteimonas aestuarii TaxID=453837 RepID=A0A4R5TRR1_9GAMM|nr:GtrA family protein [Luteimonas aestuarii]TDK23209.1 GtrA family protein [Luteimonas aestuarii]
MRLANQGGIYVVAGLGQLLLDWCVFVACSALGMPIVPANVFGRISGALLGFWLNGRFTFRDGHGARLGWRRFARFVALWSLLTVASTVLVAWVDARLGLQLAWAAKPLVEGGLAVVAFFLWRHIVYR